MDCIMCAERMMVISEGVYFCPNCGSASVVIEGGEDSWYIPSTQTKKKAA